jgi:hypothetical protein
MKALLPLLLLALAGCVSKPYDYDSEINFCALETFAWAEHSIGEDAVIDSELVAKRVQRVAESTLVTAGFRTISVGETADFVLSYRLAETHEREPRMTGVLSTGYGGGRHHRHHTTGVTWVHVFDETDAWSLIIDAHDASGNLLWRGWRRIDPQGATVSERNVQRAVTAILEGFPPYPCSSNAGG